MATEFEFNQDEFSLADVKATIEAAVGEPVAVVASWPVGDKPGRIRFERDIEGDQPPLELDPAVVVAALVDARAKERQRDQAQTPLADMLAAFRSARTPVEQMATVERLLTHLAAKETAERQRDRESRTSFRQRRAKQAEAATQVTGMEFVSPRRRDRPGVLFTREERIARKQRVERGEPESGGGPFR